MNQPYSAGFISGTEHLYKYEIRQVIPLLEQGMERAQIREKVLSENLFLQKSHHANVVLFRKVFKRVSVLDPKLMDVVMRGTSSDVNAVLLYAFLKNYRFLREFAYEVILYRYEQGRTVVTNADIVDFFERKEEQSAQVREFSLETKHKMRQVMLRAFVEAELLVPADGEWQIRPIPVSDELKKYVLEHPEHRMLLDITLARLW